MYKICSKCKIEKELNLFSLKNSSKDKLDHYCKICRNISSSEYKKQNKDKIKDYNSDHYRNNVDQHIRKAVKWQQLNPVKYKISSRKSRIKWATSNSSLILAKAAKRRAAKLKALPKWLTKAEHEQIKELYTCAQMFKLYTGEEYHVDHIVPLQGENVCGLHVPWNLQVIPAKENLSKSNKLEE